MNSVDQQLAGLLSDLSDNVSWIPSSEAGSRYTRDWADLYGAPAPVVRPRRPEVVPELVRRLNAAGLRVAVQGGMTGLVGAGAPAQGEVVLSLELLDRIEDCDPYAGAMTVQAGVPLQRVQEEAEKNGLFYPVDLGARGSCLIGGNIATNAGGNRVLQYGMTRHSVLGLEVVLPDGQVISRMSPVMKDNAGYDLKQLFIGSEGTLGVVTRAILKLQALPRERMTVAIGLDHLHQVLEALAACRSRFGPMLTSFEVMWRDYVDLVAHELGIGSDPFDRQCAFVVLVELSCFDSDAGRDEARVTDALGDIAASLDTSHVVMARSLADAARLWRLRDAAGEAARSMAPYLSFDISLPLRQLEQFLADLQPELKAIDPQLKGVTYGHLGDGNLHMLFSAEGALAQRVDELVYRRVRDLGGSISAEHGVGLCKREFFERLYPPVEVDLMRRIKHVIDPQGFINRDRIFHAA